MMSDIKHELEQSSQEVEEQAEDGGDEHYFSIDIVFNKDSLHSFN